MGTLPGVGSVLKEKLEKQIIQTCGQLRLISKVKHFSGYGHVIFVNSKFVFIALFLEEHVVLL